MKGMIVGWGLAVAGSNELVWRNGSTLSWVWYQTLGPILLFGVALVAALPALRSHYIGTCNVRPQE